MRLILLTLLLAGCQTIDEEIPTYCQLECEAICEEALKTQEDFAFKLTHCEI